MTHDKIKQAARERMRRTGESYTEARRKVVTGHDRPEPPRVTESGPEQRWFELSYREAGLDRITAWMDTLLGAGPGHAGVGVGDEEIRIRVGEFRLEIPRSRITGAHRLSVNLHGTTGIHNRGGRWLINGGPDGLVEVLIAPPVHTRQQLSSLFRRLRVDSVRLSLVDPDGFLAALGFGPGAREARNQNQQRGAHNQS